MRMTFQHKARAGVSIPEFDAKQENAESIALLTSSPSKAIIQSLVAGESKHAY